MTRGMWRGLSPRPKHRADVLVDGDVGLDGLLGAPEYLSPICLGLRCAAGSDIHGTHRRWS